jgi:hypothetical protein
MVYRGEGIDLWIFIVQTDRGEYHVCNDVNQAKHEFGMSFRSFFYVFAE